jgi:hypothetical protein
MEGTLLRHAGQQVDSMLAGDTDQVGSKVGVPDETQPEQ